MIQMHKTGLDCPICGKPDGCLLSEDGDAVICSRVEKGCIKTVGSGPFSGGYLHILPDKVEPRISKRMASTQNSRPYVSWNVMHKYYKERWATLPADVRADEAQDIGVSLSTLNKFEVGYDGDALIIPMWNTVGKCQGLQRRFPDGHKQLVKHSRQGLFHQHPLPITKSTLLICEGFSDTAAATEIGFDAIGRYNCATGKETICNLLSYDKLMPQCIIIMSDNDDAGTTGAIKLAAMLMDIKGKVALLHPPDRYKDLRGWIADTALTHEQFVDYARDNHNLYKGIIT